MPQLGKIEFTSTNREFSLEDTETNAIIKTMLKPIHATDPNILRFIDNYLVCRDAKQAARLSGLHARDGLTLLERKDVYECIQKITESGVRKFGYDAAEIVEKVKEVVFLDPAEVQNEDGSFIDNLHDIPPEVRRAIKKMEVKNFYEGDENGIPRYAGKVIKYEFYDKMPAVQMLGREKDTFKEKKVVEHNVGKNMRDVLLASARRGEQALIDSGETETIDVTPTEG